MELSEEEIIRNVKRIIEYKVISNYINNYDSRVIQGLLDLYYKQQKEIEKLNFENHMLKKWNKQLDKNCISKDKIRKIINKYVDIDEHLKYTNQELYGEELKNMIFELLEESTNE